MVNWLTSPEEQGEHIMWQHEGFKKSEPAGKKTGYSKQEFVHAFGAQDSVETDITPLINLPAEWDRIRKEKHFSMRQPSIIMRMPGDAINGFLTNKHKTIRFDSIIILGTAILNSFDEVLSAIWDVRGYPNNHKTRYRKKEAA